MFFSICPSLYEKPLSFLQHFLHFPVQIRQVNFIIVVKVKVLALFEDLSSSLQTCYNRPEAISKNLPGFVE